MNLLKSLTKRSKLEGWEFTLMVRLFSLLPDEFEKYRRQLEDGLIKGVLLSDKPTPNYVIFTFDPAISKRFEEDKERSFFITGVRAFDKKDGDWNSLEVYFSHGLLCGYRLREKRKAAADFSEIQVDNFEKVYQDMQEQKIMNELLVKSEIDLINPSDFYEVSLNGRDYYHLKDLEDGDFIGIDKERKVYRITHDPLEIMPLEADIQQILTHHQ